MTSYPCSVTSDGQVFYASVPSPQAYYGQYHEKTLQGYLSQLAHD